MISCRLTRLLTFIGLCGACIAQTLAAEGDDDGIVVLPPFQVLDSRLWLYASIPGYEILSLENENATRRLASDLQRAGRFMPWFFPSHVFGEARGKSVVFIDRITSSRTINEAKERLKVPKVDLFTVNGSEGAAQFASAETVSAWLAGRRSLSRVWFSGLGISVRPPIPQWYREGVGSLLTSAKISDTKLEFPGQSIKLPTTLPLEELLAVKKQDQAVQLAAANMAWGPRYRRSAILFVRWGLFSDAGVRRAAFVDFAASGLDANDANFQRFFGITAAELNVSLEAFAKETGRRPLTLPLPKEPSPSTLPLVTVRLATENEVARIVGGSYLALSRQTGLTEASRDRYRTLARKNLTSPSLDLRDPYLQAVLGAQAFLDRNFDEARASVGAARRAGLATPQLYFLEAVLRLRALDSDHGDSRPLSPAEKETVLDPLRAGLKLLPRPLDSYRLLAEVHTRDDAEVPESDLALLLSGTRENPETLDLLAKTALLHFRQGRRDVAAELVTRGLAAPGIDRTPHKATFLGLKLKLEEDAAPFLPLPIPR